LVLVTRLSAFGFAEIRAFERGPQHDERFGVSGPHPADVFCQRREFQRADVLREVESIRMVGGMRGDGVRIVVDAGDDLCALLVSHACLFDAGGRSARAAKEVDV